MSHKERGKSLVGVRCEGQPDEPPIPPAAWTRETSCGRDWYVYDDGSEERV